MLYREIKKDYFTEDNKCYFAQCSSTDFILDSKQCDFKKMKNFCIPVGYGLNLITKYTSTDITTENNIKNALVSMREYCQTNEIRKVIFSSDNDKLDGIKLCNVYKIIKDVFNDVDIEIVIYVD